MERNKGKPNNGILLASLIGDIKVFLCSRWGYTVREYCEVMGIEQTQWKIERMSKHLRRLSEAGLLTSDKDHRDVVKPNHGGHGKTVTMKYQVNRYRIHPDLLREIWESHRHVFDAMSEQKRGAA